MQSSAKSKTVVSVQAALHTHRHRYYVCVCVHAYVFLSGRKTAWKAASAFVKVFSKSCNPCTWACKPHVYGA
eukprot:3963318-Amphidinium_carterae.1